MAGDTSAQVNQNFLPYSISVVSAAILSTAAATAAGWILYKSFGYSLGGQKREILAPGSKEPAEMRRALISNNNDVSSTLPQRVQRDGVIGCIGNTPLIRIRSLSDATGCEILAKAEFLNPGGSVKDRVALQIIKEALESGQLSPGGLITEGSAGSTGISLAMVASAFNCQAFVAMPDDAAGEKAEMMEALGAHVEKVRPVAISHSRHFVNVARKKAEEAEEWEEEENGDGGEKGSAGNIFNTDLKNESGSRSNLKPWLKRRMARSSPQTSSESLELDKPLSQSESLNSDLDSQMGKQGQQNGVHGKQKKRQSAFFADQFENLANFRAHYWGTGLEIWEQSNGKVDAFVAAAGTGGTIAGVSRCLKDRDANIKCFLIDPPGSSLYNRVTRGVLFTKEEAEGKRLRNPFDTITEGIGINRLTANFLEAKLDGAFRGTDKEAVEMARYLLKNDGLFVGSSAAMNCVGAVRVARQLGPNKVIVTILCDGGQRHVSKFHNPQYLAALGLSPTAHGLEFLD